MKRRKLPTIPSLALALLALVLAAATALASLVRALQGQDRRAATRETIVIPASLRSSGGRVASYAPVADDPFFPGRTPPATRYRLASTSGGALEGQNDPNVPVILGTAISDDSNGSSFAISALGAAPPKTVRLGDTIGGYRVATIERGRVAFVTPEGRRLTVTSSEAGRLLASRRSRRNPFGNSFPAVGEDNPFNPEGASSDQGSPDDGADNPEDDGQD